ncbi:sigma-54-dependent Fis family transcriptional regulator [Neobacillus muris]|uniref:sigma-54-dependent Fis family transcriptional regulator n=1 Tax=Neobacillus muris TaxID=2941334 RepID=UPI0020407D45|nr:sigma-54-dependent Fis family transcriptional regulator [Neobacillus muris]
MHNQIGEAEIIQKSWKRCHVIGLDPVIPSRNPLIEEKRLDHVMKENQGLLQQAVPVLEKFFPEFKQMRQVAVLVDRNGIVIHAIGDPELLHRTNTIHLSLGANWNEQSMGTNAISVSLIEKRPVQVRGNEHFFAAAHFLACSASPIYTPSGELAGVINISSRIEDHHPMNLHLACMAAELIQDKLVLERNHAEKLVLQKEMDVLSDQLPYPALLLDQDERVVRANQAAQNFFGYQPLGEPIRRKEYFKIEEIYDNRNRFWGSVAISRTGQPPSATGRLHTFNDVAGQCRKLVETKELGKKVSYTNLPVLLIGESGTGKELMAQSIHSHGPLQDGPFIAVNCSAIPESLIESEWFGYEPGAFTGANRRGSIGKFEAAHGGTIFLDEIGDMSLRAQAALLRVLQEKMITPVGSTKSKPIDVRVISATHRNLIEEIKAGRFRSDLYYRLKGIQINLPSLRDREDLPFLAEFFLQRMNYPARALSKSAMDKLASYRWPGNIRELRNVLLQAAFLADGQQITSKHILFEKELAETPENPANPTITLEDTEKRTIKNTLQLTDWNISKAAKLLKISRSTLYRKINEYNIQPY